MNDNNSNVIDFVLWKKRAMGYVYRGQGVWSREISFQEQKLSSISGRSLSDYEVIRLNRKNKLTTNFSKETDNYNSGQRIESGFLDQIRERIARLQKLLSASIFDAPIKFSLKRKRDLL